MIIVPTNMGENYSNMKEEIIKKLEEEGWIVECESPLEIRHDDSESFASGWAAEIVIDELTTESPDHLRIEKLQRLTTGYGKGWILRDSSTGRGMRLHETELEGATPCVREAIDNYEEE